MKNLSTNEDNHTNIDLIYEYTEIDTPRSKETGILEESINEPSKALSSRRY